VAIEQVVQALGGHLATAYLVGMSLGGIYRIIREGKVHAARHAILMRKLAAEKGVYVTIEELAGMADDAVETPASAPRRPRTTTTATA